MLARHVTEARGNDGRIWGQASIRLLLLMLLLLLLQHRDINPHGDVYSPQIIAEAEKHTTSVM